MVRIIFLYFISGIIVQSGVVESYLAVGMMTVNIVLLLLFSYAVLSVRRLKQRFVQTLSAILGTGIIFNLLAWPFAGFINAEGLSNAEGLLMAIVMLSMLSWELLVVAHIYRNALNLQMAHSIILSLLLFFISMFLTQIIFPELS